MRLILPVALIALAGCIGPAGATDVSTLTPTEAGRKLYIAKCARCHKLYDPKEYSDEEWDKWMARMTRKSKLKPQQADLVARYVDTLRGRTNSTGQGTSSIERPTPNTNKAR